jgi:rhodanese-related sulfurtransferase
MIHSEGFLRVVNEAKTRIREVTVDEVLERTRRGERFTLIDVREDHEWDAGRAEGAIHIGRGILERDIEKVLPDHGAEIVLYCGGGFRSALSADMLQKMGYTAVFSLAGGIKAWRDQGGPMES